MNKIFLTNEDFSRMAGQLCSQILKIRDQFQWVVGIERGGLPLSQWLAYALQKPHSSITISLYGDRTVKTGTPPHIWFGPHWDKIIKSPFLLVDDIVDSGETLRLFQELTFVDKATYWLATLHWCEENSPNQKPDFFVEKKRKADWIVYPWEKDEECPQQVVDKH